MTTPKEQHAREIYSAALQNAATRDITLQVAQLFDILSPLNPEMVHLVAMGKPTVGILHNLHKRKGAAHIYPVSDIHVAYIALRGIDIQRSNVQNSHGGGSDDNFFVDWTSVKRGVIGAFNRERFQNYKKPEYQLAPRETNPLYTDMFFAEQAGQHVINLLNDFVNTTVGV